MVNLSKKSKLESRWLGASTKNSVLHLVWLKLEFFCFIESLLRMMKMLFFHRKSFFRSQDIYNFLLTVWSCKLKNYDVLAWLTND